MTYTIAQWKQKGVWFLHRGHKIFFIAEGSGPSLLLLHGFPTASWDWNKIWDSLTPSYRVVTLDFIGFGFSDKPGGYSYSIFDQSDLVEGLLKHLDIQSYHILSHDVGDTVAQELLARDNERHSNQIISCCLLNGGLFPETHHATRTQKMLLGPLGFLIARMMNFKRFARSFTVLFPASTKPSEEELRSFYSLIEFNGGSKNMHRLIRYILERRQNRERWLSSFQKFQGPLMLIDGLDDPVSGAHMVARYRELIPNPRVVELTGCGHYPQTEKPQEVLKAYLEFRVGT